MSNDKWIKLYKVDSVSMSLASILSDRLHIFSRLSKDAETLPKTQKWLGKKE
jgi:hypothetical protein